MQDDCHYRRFVNALRHDDLAGIVAALVGGVSPDAAVDGMPALSRALLERKYRVAAELLRRGCAAIVHESLSAKSPLLYIAEHQPSEGQVAVAVELLRRGVDPDVKGPSGDAAFDVVTRKGNLRLASLLLSHGATCSAASMARYEALVSSYWRNLVADVSANEPTPPGSKDR